MSGGWRSRMRRGPGAARSLSFLRGGSLALFLAVGAAADEGFEPPVVPLFNWDVLSLEQNNPRFNGSMLTGFHSVRSPGVTPPGGKKLGMGILYMREEQFTRAGDRSFFRRNQVFLNPKANYGIWQDVEVGGGLTASYVAGRELVPDTSGAPDTRFREEVFVDSADLGLKWQFLDAGRYRLAASFDTRLALARGEFGSLPGNLFNIELDGDFAVTPRFSLAGNLQFLTADSDALRDQFVGDLAAVYSFTDNFRGMVFGTLQEDDEAATVLGFLGLAGQYVFERHAFTLAVDLQLNDAERDIRTEEQIDISLSYAFTF